jgi:RNA polymerase sigma factor (sigma-70 family)
MTDSQKLLVEYATSGSEPAFRELVSRYLDLVYSTAVRLVGGDTHLAQDVAQTVFVDLARKARTLPYEVMLGGWLHRHTCFVASKIVRGERRRQFRETQAVAMNEQQDYSEANLAQVAPILDEAINRLGAEARTAILLRFFEQLDLRSVGEALGSSENAAQKRVSRALEELRGLLKKRGVVFSTAALGTGLAGEAVTAAPAGLAVAISSIALAGASAGTGTTLTLIKLMTTTQLKLGLGVLVVAGVATTLVIQHQAQEKLRGENESLRQQISRLQSDNLSLSHGEAAAKLMLRLPAPHMPAATAAEPPAEDLQATNLFDRFKDQAPKLTAGQVEAYLKSNGRNASSLLAAYRTGGDPALLKEAMEKYPNDPQVAFEAVLYHDLSPEAQRHWLNTFKQSAPDNALANYLSAFNYFKAGQTDQAVQDLTAATGKSLDDYTLNRAQADEEAYLSAGYSAAEAIRISDSWLVLPQLGEMKQTARDMIALADAYQQSGDQASAQASLQMAMNMGQALRGASSSSAALISQLTGMAIETLALNAMDLNSPYGGNGQTAQDQLNQIVRDRAAISELVQRVTPLLPTMSNQDVLNYENRRRAFGEVAALQWVVSKYGQP